LDVLAKDNIDVMLMKRKVTANYVYTGALYAHAESVCNYLLQRVGGPGLAVFKIGISANIIERWAWYKKENFQSMIVLCVSQDLSAVEGLEAFLIRLFRHHAGCRNEKPGGEGMRKEEGKARSPPPYLCYIVGAPANIMKRIGS